MPPLLVDQDVETLGLLLDNVPTDPDQVALRNRWIEESHASGSTTEEVIRIYRLLWTGLTTREHALGAISRHVSSRGGLWPPTPSAVLAFRDETRRIHFPARESFELTLLDCLDEIDMIHDSDANIALWAGRDDSERSRYHGRYCIVAGMCGRSPGLQRTILFSVDPWSTSMTPVCSAPVRNRATKDLSATRFGQEFASHPMMATFLNTLRVRGRHLPIPGHHEVWNHMCAFDDLYQAEILFEPHYRVESIHEFRLKGPYKILLIDDFHLRLALSLFEASVMAKNSKPLFCHSLSLSALVARAGRIPYDAINSLPAEAALAVCPYLWRQICLQRPDPKGCLPGSNALLDIARLMDIEIDEEQRQRPELIASIVGQRAIPHLSKSIFDVPCSLPRLPRPPCHCVPSDYEKWIKLAGDRAYLDRSTRDWASSHGLADVEKIAKRHQMFGYAALAISASLIEA